MIHPNVAFDLRSQTAVTDVIAYQIRQDGQAVRNGSIGTWGGVEFIENPRAHIQTGAGSGGIDVYDTVIAGRWLSQKVSLVPPASVSNHKSCTAQQLTTSQVRVSRLVPLVRIQQVP